MARNGSETDISRRNMIAVTMTVTASLYVSRAGAQTAKISQAQAGYRPRANDGQSCGVCVHFLPPRSCGIVDGDISPQGWCSLFSGN